MCFGVSNKKGLKTNDEKVLGHEKEKFTRLGQVYELTHILDKL